MGAPRIRWTEDADAYLKKKFDHTENEKLMRGLKKKGIRCSVYAMIEHAKGVLGLRKDESWMKEYRKRLALECCEKRGEDFRERQRQRALHPGESGWWGGRHNDGSKMPREKRAEIARKNFHTDPDVKRRREETRLRTVKRDLRRLELGLEPLTNIHNLGEALTRDQQRQRKDMRVECGYITFRTDKNIYYDESTRRSARREKTAEERGLTVMPLRLRGKAGVTAPHYDERIRLNNDN